MNNNSSIFSLCVIALLIYSGCKPESHNHFIIQNNSSKIIRIVPSSWPVETPVNFCLKPSFEYENMYSDDCRVLPYSQRDFVETGADWYGLVTRHDTTYFYVYLIDDIINMTCDEFKQINPVIHFWKVTRDDMEACDWTLVYSPKEPTDKTQK